LDLLRLGKAPAIIRVLVGDSVDVVCGARDRLRDDERAELVVQARAALERMIEVTERHQGS
ncbi:MAG: quinolinate synthase NadA, partial [Planctomycetota bacterium]|nr:quinolinate synthase NadA [Planctomycetota bacterium]